MNTLPHRFLHTFAPNTALLALVIATHALLGWWLWTNSQTSISPSKPPNTVEVLLLPAMPSPPKAPSVPSAQQAKPTAQAKLKANPPPPKVTSRQQAAPTATPSRIQETSSTLPAPTILPTATPTTTPLAEALTPSSLPDKTANNTDNNSNNSNNSSSKSSTASPNAPSTNSTTSAPIFSAAYLNNPNPVYPAVSRQLNEQGRVLLRVHVGADGLVMDLDIKSSSGFARLDKSARDAVQRWRFVPAQQNGQAIAAWVVVPISFFLKG